MHPLDARWLGIALIIAQKLDIIPFPQVVPVETVSKLSVGTWCICKTEKKKVKNFQRNIQKKKDRESSSDKKEPRKVVIIKICLPRMLTSSRNSLLLPLLFSTASHSILRNLDFLPYTLYTFYKKKKKKKK